MFTKIRKRDGREVPFDDSKITDAIFMAARAVGGEDREQAVSLTLNVLRMLREQYNGNLFGVEDVQDVVEKVLIEEGHARTAKAYILYRDKRTRMRDAKTELMDVVEDIVRETDKDNPPQPRCCRLPVQPAGTIICPGFWMRIIPWLISRGIYTYMI